MAIAPKAIADAMQRALPRRWAAGSIIAGDCGRRDRHERVELLNGTCKPFYKACAHWYIPPRQAAFNGGRRTAVFSAAGVAIGSTPRCSSHDPAEVSHADRNREVVQ